MEHGGEAVGTGGTAVRTAGVRRAVVLSEQGFAEAFAGLVRGIRSAADPVDYDPATSPPSGVDDASQVLAGVRHAVTGLRAAIDWLKASSDDDGTDPKLLAAVLAGLGEVDSVVVAAVSRGIVRAEEIDCATTDGEASVTDWVATQMRLSRRAAGRACQLAAGLDGLPDVLTALETGEISRDHAAELVAADRQQRRDHEEAERARRRAAADAEDAARRAADAAARAAADEAERERLRRETEEHARRRREREAEEAARRAAEAEAARQARQDDLLGKAVGGDTPDAISDEADRQRATDPDALLRAEAAQWRRRSVRTWTDRETGAGCGRWTLPWEEHEELQALLDSLRTFDPPGVEPDERRTFEQRQADAFIDLIDVATTAATAPTSRGQRPHLNATVPLDTLAGASDEPGRTRYGTRLSADALRRIGCDATLIRIVLDAASQVLDVGRATRQWTAAQFTAAEQTFGGCAFPTGDGRMCGRPPGWTELHHVHWWRHGGRTDQENGVLLCKRHHRAVHHEGWDLTYDKPGRTVAVTRRQPDGTTLRRTVDLTPRHHPDPPAAVEPDRLPL